MLVEGVFGRMENGCPISSWVEEMVQFLSVFVFGTQQPCQESHNCLVLELQGSDVALLGMGVFRSSVFEIPARKDFQRH